MTASRSDNEAIFHAARDIPDAARRREYVRQACGGDEARIAHVEALLAAANTPDSLLDRPARKGAAATIAQPTPESRGTKIRAYKLVEEIGEGGMGTVWMAQQQEPVKRLVAVKLIKAGMDSKQVIARFEAERQALALMDHPNIARVLDAGTTEAGRPYFVMDLVKGVPITRYCDEHHLTPRQRLDLFIPVCQAIQHAHQKGIIHRDLKPSNVLVALYDGKPVPKVIDFGVAKAAGQPLTEKTLLTGFGNIVGTVEYMSPEQAEINQLDIDTRSDIYSLGVLLYELLTGSTPFSKKDLEKAGMLEMLRVIREQEPSKPSTKLSTAEGLPTLAANRGTEPAKLTRLVRGELDWIVMKALEKDRSRRYETANGFAMDVQRYLADEPVQACPPSALYRFGKFARRNRIAFTTSLLVLAALLIGTIVSTTQMIRATRAERLARERLMAETEAHAEAETARQAEAAQREIAETRRAEADANFRKARQAVDEYFTVVSESKLFDVPGLQPLRKQLLESALRYYQGFLEQRSQDPTTRAEVAATYLRIAHIYEQNDQSNDSTRAFQRGLELVEDLLRGNPQRADLLKLLAGVRKGGRIAHMWEQWPSDLPGAVRVYAKAAAVWETLVRENPSALEVQSDLAAFYWRIGDLQWGRQAYAEALPAFQKASRIWEKLAEDHPSVPEYRADLAESLDHVGKVLMDTGRRLESEAAYRRALALREKLVAEFPDYPDYRAGLANGFRRLGTALQTFGRPKEAEDAWRQSLAIWEQLTTEYPSFAAYRKLRSGTYESLGTLQIETGRPAEAEKAYRQSLELKEKLIIDFPGTGDTVNDFTTTLTLLTNRLKAAGRSQEAEQFVRERLQTFTAAIEKSPKSATLLVGRGEIYLELKQPDKALADLSKAIEIAPNDTLAPFCYLDSSNAYEALKQPDKQLAMLSKAVERWPNAFGVHAWRGWCYYRRKEWDHVIADFSTVIALNPNYWPAWRDRGSAYANLNQWDHAISDYARLIELNPEQEAAIVEQLKTSGGSDTQTGTRRVLQLYDELLRHHPESALHRADLAWFLATCPDTKLRDPKRAVEFAKKAIELAPRERRSWKSLGVSQYRYGDWKAAIDALQKSTELGSGGDGFDFFFLAMAHWQLSQKDEARKWRDRAVVWMDKNQEALKKDRHGWEELNRVRDEAAQLLEINKQ